MGNCSLLPDCCYCYPIVIIAGRLHWPPEVIYAILYLDRCFVMWRIILFNEHNIEFGIIAFALGTIGYGGSIVYYNSFLPVICPPEEQDKVSARGYSMGYLGGVVLLIFNLVMIMKPAWFGIADPFCLPVFHF